MLQAIFDSIPALLVYLDENLVCRRCNAAAAAEMGRSVEHIVGRHLRELAPGNPQVLDAVEGVLRTGQPFRSEALPVAWPGRPDEGTQYYSVACLPYRDAAGRVRGVIVQAQQVTALVEARQQAQEARDELEARFAERTAALTRANEELRFQATVLANVTDAVVATDRNRLTRYVNPAAERQGGWRAEEVLGKNPVHLFRAEFLHTTDVEFAREVETNGCWQGEVIVHRRDGTSFYADATAEALWDEAGQLLGHVGVYHDITAHKLLEEALRAGQEQSQAYSRRLVAAVENEKRTLARDLHDQAGQSAWALKLMLGRIRRELDASGRQTALFEKVDELVNAVMEDLRRLTLNLRPASLDRAGLMPALNEYLDFYRSHSGLNVELILEGLEERLPADVEIALYRVVQEALTNVLRYAQARRVRVRLECDGVRVVATVEDDGQGFDVAEALRSERLGLLGMRERAQMLGGSLTVTSTPETGTVVTMEVPIRGCGSASGT